MQKRGPISWMKPLTDITKVTKSLILPAHSTKQLQPEPANSRACIVQF